MGCVRSVQATENIFFFFLLTKLYLGTKLSVYFLKEILVLIFHKTTAVSRIQNKRHKMCTYFEIDNKSHQ